MVSYSPAQEMHTWWERALIPFVFCRLAQLYSYAAVNDPESPAAAANGQYLLVRREAYDAIGGHAAVCGEVLEDVALAQRAKAAGVALYLRPRRGDRACADVFELSRDVGGLDEEPLSAAQDAGPNGDAGALSVIPWIPLLCFLANAHRTSASRCAAIAPAGGPPRQLRWPASAESFPAL